MICYDCKECRYKYTVKCESGNEYIVCDNQKCQEEKKQLVGNSDRSIKKVTKNDYTKTQRM